MARLKGTGTDPLGRYGDGEIFDVPSTDPLYTELIDKGYATAVAPEDDPARTKPQIADAVVSGQSLTDPVDRKVAREIGDAAHDVVLTGDPEAEKGDAGLSPGDEPDYDPLRVSPAQVNASSIASADPVGSAKAAEEANAKHDKEQAKARKAAEKAERDAEKEDAGGE